MSFAQPIPYKVKYYSSKDKNAPVFMGNSGDFYTLLKACLVTGYGEKESAGWEVLFIDDEAQKITLKRPETVGTKHVLHFRKAATNSRNILAAQFEPKSIDDENYSHKIEAIFDRPHPLNIPYEWHFIICDRGFFCFFSANNRYFYNSSIYFGDMAGPDGANFLYVGGGDMQSGVFRTNARIFSTNASNHNHSFIHGWPDSNEEPLGVLLHLRELVKFYDAESSKRYTLSFPFKRVYITIDEAENKKIAGMTVDVDGEKHLLLGYRNYGHNYHSIPLEYWYF